MTTETDAAQARRQVRKLRDAEARYAASQPRPAQTRTWRLIENGTAFHCEQCGTAFGGYIDPAQSTGAAQDHVTKTCPKAVRDV